jgi:hypothetical protein
VPNPNPQDGEIGMRAGGVERRGGCARAHALSQRILQSWTLIVDIYYCFVTNL